MSLYTCLNDHKGIPLVKKIEKYLNYESGFYVELGAFDGLTQSNTDYFEKNKQWSGLLIEPNPDMFAKISQHRASHNFLCNAIISNSDQDKLIGDFYGNHIMASLNGQRCRDPRRKKQVTIKNRKMKDVFAEFKVTLVDFFSLDVEGQEFNVLKSIDFDSVHIKSFLIEIYHNDLDAITQYLQQYQYTLIENISNYNSIDNPLWDGTHNDYLFMHNRYIFDADQMITGEQIQLQCDYMIGRTRDFTFNPIIRKSDRKRWINLDHYDRSVAIQGHKIFVYGDAIDQIQSLKFHNQVTLYIHNSDKNIDNQYESLRCHPNIKKIYAQNLLIPQDNFFKLLPIGIANSMWTHGNLNLLTQTITKKLPKSQQIYVNFNIQTNPQKRQPCYDLVSKKYSIQLNLTQSEYLKTLATYQYCICPEGNGIDSHRIWECLYLGVIPICPNNLFTQNLRQMGYPIKIVDTWNDLGDLTYREFVPMYDKLKLNYFI